MHDRVDVRPSPVDLGMDRVLQWCPLARAVDGLPLEVDDDDVLGSQRAEEPEFT
jgi:hypothetical protein